VGETIRILPQIAEALRQRRLTLVTVSGLLVPMGVFSGKVFE